MDRIYERIESDGFDSLTLSERASFGLTHLYMETHNGGLHQFFFNDAGKLAPDALRGLEMVGAPKTASILRRAMSVFPDGVVPSDQEQRREFMCDSLTEDQEDLLSSLTTEFFQARESVAELLDTYVEKHPEEFPT
ncbi:MAG: DMP19 family protein [Verrucomicrobia bacterium]|nr:DMP19 family protein [Verrucomicrobiota bacterium]